MTDLDVSPIEVLDFWWKAGPEKWFARNDAFDAEIGKLFLPAIEAAQAGKLRSWAQTPHGALALILLLDQFTRNVFRDDPRAFEADGQALGLAELALEHGFDRAFPTQVRVFFYLPFEHSEDMAHQEKAVDLCRGLGQQDFYHYALIHMDVIRRFGRFPHRNKVLGRETTPEEQSFLDNGGFSA
ncbi:DUF924 family protein [Roseibium sp.]|uniref:DUF924 family protein n=1 Tax=Roseibium sp. TaxID=1936156 RepID=UPI003A97E408